MDNSNFQNVVKLARNVNDIAKVKLILDETSDENIDVPDPYYGGDQGFQDVFNMLDEACTNIANKLA